MDQLPSVIGLAPSELSIGDFKRKLTKERERVRRGLDFFKNQVMSKGKKKKKVSDQRKLAALFKEANLSPQEFLKGIEKLKQQKENSPERTNS